MDNDRLYEPLRDWQTRVLRLHPAQQSDAVLCVDLLRAGFADGSYLALSMDEPLITFEAISYTWGDKAGAQENIVCNGLSKTIYSSLGAALRRFRLRDDFRYLWADALCINQSDNAEKNIQVANMFKIFSKASTVLVWLGEEDPRLGEAIAVLRSHGMLNDAYRYQVKYEKEDPASKYHAVSMGLNYDLRQALMDLCLKPWNRRAWVQQEVFAARHLELFCGAQSFTLEAYGSALLCVLNMKWFQCPDGSSIDHPSPTFKKLYQAVEHLAMAKSSELFELRQNKAAFDTGRPSYKRFAFTRGDRGRPFEKVMQHSRNLEASDARDHVYALLNLTPCPVLDTKSRYQSGRLGISIDYSLSLSQVFQDVTRFIMNNDESIIVLEEYKPRANKSPSMDGLPSWTIDWRTQKPSYREGILYANYLDGRQWNWQLPNPEGTTTVNGTLLATIHVINGLPPPKDLEPYWLSLEVYSYVSYRVLMLPKVQHSTSFFCVEKGYFTSYQRFLSRQNQDARRFWDYKMLNHVQPGDILVQVDGMAKRLAFLRPVPNTSRFTFVCIVNLGAYLELIVGAPAYLRIGSRWPNSNLFETSHTNTYRQDSGDTADDAFDALLSTETGLHRDFVIC